MELMCAFCLNVRKDEVAKAITIINGQAACFDHMYYCQYGEYNKIRALIEHDVPNNH